MELIKKNIGQKNIIQGVLDILIDYDSDIKKYNQAIDDYNELGGLDKISEAMGWNDTQKENWKKRIETVYNIK